MNIIQKVYRFLFVLLCLIGRPFGGIRPRRIYHIIARLGYKTPEFNWYRNQWGDSFFLSPYYHIDRYIISFGTYDKNLHLLLERILKPGMICIDVGANLGEVTLHMASKVGVGGMVYAFEPVSPIYERLKLHIEKHVKQNIIKAFQLALSNKTGRAPIHFSDVLNDNQGLATLLDTGAEKSLTLCGEVTTTTLDEFAAQQNIRKVDLVKIDIQGAEILLLEGGRNVFTDLSPEILIEISPSDLKYASKDSRDLIRLLEKYGYTVYEVKYGNVGKVISSSQIEPTFYATNVFCTKKRSLVPGDAGLGKQ